MTESTNAVIHFACIIDFVSTSVAVNLFAVNRESNIGIGQVPLMRPNSILVTSIRFAIPCVDDIYEIYITIFIIVVLCEINSILLIR